MTSQEIVNFLNSVEFQKAVFPYKIAFIIISIIFLGAIIYFMLRQQYLVQDKVRPVFNFLTFRGYKKGEKGRQKKWQKILKLLEKDIDSEYKLAVIETSDMFSDIFKRLGYDGRSVLEQLSILPKEMVSEGSINLLRDLAVLRDNIVADPNYKINLKEVKKNILSCEAVLKELGII